MGVSSLHGERTFPSTSIRRTDRWFDVRIIVRPIAPADTPTPTLQAPLSCFFSSETIPNTSWSGSQRIRIHSAR